MQQIQSIFLFIDFLWIYNRLVCNALGSGGLFVRKVTSCYFKSRTLSLVSPLGGRKFREQFVLRKLLSSRGSSRIHQPQPTPKWHHHQTTPFSAKITFRPIKPAQNNWHSANLISTRRSPRFGVFWTIAKRHRSVNWTFLARNALLMSSSAPTSHSIYASTKISVSLLLMNWIFN